MARLELLHRRDDGGIILARHAAADEVAGNFETALQGCDFLPALAGLHRRGRHHRPAALRHDRPGNAGSRPWWRRCCAPESVGVPSAGLVIRSASGVSPDRSGGGCSPWSRSRSRLLWLPLPPPKKREQSRATSRRLLLLLPVAVVVCSCRSATENGPALEGCDAATRSVAAKPAAARMLPPLSQFRH